MTMTTTTLSRDQKAALADLFKTETIAQDAAQTAGEIAEAQRHDGVTIGIVRSIAIITGEDEGTVYGRLMEALDE